MWVGGVAPSNVGAYEAAPHPTLGGGDRATWRECRLKRSQKHSKKRSKWANYTITAAKLSRSYHENFIFAWDQNEKTDILHSEHFSLLYDLEVAAGGRGAQILAPPWPWLRLPPLRHQTWNVSRKRQQIGNCSSDVFFWIFVRNLAVNILEKTDLSPCKEEKEKETRDAEESVTVTVDDDPEEMMGCETVGRFRRGRIWGLEDFGRICHRFGRIWIGCVRLAGDFKDNSIYFERSTER